MKSPTREDLTEAARALQSMIAKLEKAHTGLSPTAKPQLTLIDRRLSALRIAQALVARELEPHDPGTRQTTAN